MSLRSMLRRLLFLGLFGAGLVGLASQSTLGRKVSCSALTEGSWLHTAYCAEFERLAGTPEPTELLELRALPPFEAGLQALAGAFGVDDDAG